MNSHHRLVFVDIETAGLKPRAPLIELAAIAVEAGSYREVESLEMKIEFEMKDAEPRALGVSKFKPSLWQRYALPPEDAAAKFAVFLHRHATEQAVKKSGQTARACARLAAYQVRFDAPRLFAWGRRTGVWFPMLRATLCVLQRTRWFFEENQGLPAPASYTLADVAAHLGLKNRPTHSALADVRTTVELARVLAQYNRITTTRAAEPSRTRKET